MNKHPALSHIASLIPNSARKLHRILKQSGHATYIVGGWVRNILIFEETISQQIKEKISSPNLNTGLGDIDFATSAKPEEVVAIFPHTHPTGIKHGTVTIIIDNDAYEVTTFRREGRYTDNRRPDEVVFSTSLEEDLIRRDFTVNAFAYEPDTEEFIDLFNGMEDLHHRLLRVICKPGESPQIRFQEDALRMMRGCRLATQFHFTIEPKTLEAIITSAPLIESISKERVRDELIKIIVAPDPALGMEYLHTTKILYFILPELWKTIGVTQNRFHVYDVYTHSLEVLKAINRLQAKTRRVDHCLSMAALFHDIAKPQTQSVDPHKITDGEPHVSFHRHEIIGAKKTSQLMKRLKFSNQDITKVTHLIRHHMFYYTSEWKDGTVRRFISRIGKDYLEPLFLLRKADRLGKGDVPPTYQENNHDLEELQKRINKILSKKSFLTLADLDIDGGILIQTLHLKSGPLIGYILKQLLEQVLDDPEKNHREYLLKEAKAILEEQRNSS